MESVPRRRKGKVWLYFWNTVIAFIGGAATGNDKIDVIYLFLSAVLILKGGLGSKQW